MKIPTIAIIGGGFCGTITAVNLARLCHRPMRICIINHGSPIGRGLAYGTRRSEHLLNVVARNMSALADQPNDFVDWLKTRSEYLDTAETDLREAFVRRNIYGDYLCGLLHRYSRMENQLNSAQIDLIAAEVVDVNIASGRAKVITADGDAIEVDRVVLALGNESPRQFPNMEAPFRHSQYVENPWTDWELRLQSRDDCAVLLGTGLTAIDAILTLSACDWRGPIVAISRNGFLPWSHFRGIEYRDFLPADIGKLKLSQLVEHLELHCAILRKQGENPAIVVDKIRQRTQHIWKQFTVEEKQEFCKRYRSTWNVIRHRVPSQIHQFVTNALATGALRIERGNICNLVAVNEKIQVTIKDKDGCVSQIEAGLVINCTGPQEGVAATKNRLLRRLLERGLIACDDLDMGIQISPTFEVIDRGGQQSDVLYAIGPLLKGTLWETTAVPELRGQALQIAQTILKQFDGQPPAGGKWTVASDEEVIEYCI